MFGVDAAPVPAGMAAEAQHGQGGPSCADRDIPHRAVGTVAVPAVAPASISSRTTDRSESPAREAVGRPSAPLACNMSLRPGARIVRWRTRLPSRSRREGGGGGPDGCSAHEHDRVGSPKYRASRRLSAAGSERGKFVRAGDRHRRAWTGFAAEVRLRWWRQVGGRSALGPTCFGAIASQPARDATAMAGAFGFMLAVVGLGPDTQVIRSISAARWQYPEPARSMPVPTAPAARTERLPHTPA